MPSREIIRESDLQVDRKVNLVGAAKHIGVTAATIRYWILTNVLPAAKVGGQWVIELSEVERVDREKRDIGWGRRGKRGHIIPNTEGATDE